MTGARGLKDLSYQQVSTSHFSFYIHSSFHKLPFEVSETQDWGSTSNVLSQTISGGLDVNLWADEKSTVFVIVPFNEPSVAHEIL